MGRKRKRKQRTKRKTQKIRRRRTKKRPTQTKRRKRKRKRRSPSNLAQDHYINKKETTRSHPARTLPRVSPGPANPRREKKICTNSKALAHSTSFPMTSYLLDRSWSVMWTKRRMNYLTQFQLSLNLPLPLMTASLRDI